MEKYKGIYDGWGTYFEDPNAEDDEYGDDGEFLTMKMSKTTTNVYINNNKGRVKSPLILSYPNRNETMKLKALSLALLALPITSLQQNPYLISQRMSALVLKQKKK